MFEKLAVNVSGSQNGSGQPSAQETINDGISPHAITWAVSNPDKTAATHNCRCKQNAFAREWVSMYPCSVIHETDVPGNGEKFSCSLPFLFSFPMLDTAPELNDP